MTESTLSPEERGFLVGVEWKGSYGTQNEDWPVEASLKELAQLASTAGIRVVGWEVQRLEQPNPATFIGSGKAEEIAGQIEEEQANVVIFDDELSPRHQRELEKVFGEDIKLLDRTALILDIFAQHAATREGALQVELAQYEYRLPRLTRAWTHLARQSGGRAGGMTGGVGLRGPGETQLETDRRVIGQRIAHLKEELEKVRAHRNRYRARRRQQGVPVVAIVGYTNAGKSTLLNALAGAEVLVEDKLFATLDPTTRRVELQGGRVVLFTDTVGFIQKLPTQLVAAFRATLEEVTEADILLHVVDVTHPQVMRHIETVTETLRELGATDKPILTALNKIDRLPDPDSITGMLEDFSLSVPISALEQQGLDGLLERIGDILEEDMVHFDVIIPFSRGDLVQMLHEQGAIEQEEYLQQGTHIVGRAPRQLLGLLEMVRGNSLRHKSSD
jgi:GTP-binding protein HflX